MTTRTAKEIFDAAEVRYSNLTQVARDLSQRLADAIVERAALRAEVERLRAEVDALRARLEAVKAPASTYCPRCHERMYP